MGGEIFFGSCDSRNFAFSGNRKITAKSRKTEFCFITMLSYIMHFFTNICAHNNYILYVPHIMPRVVVDFPCIQYKFFGARPTYSSSSSTLCIVF